MNNFFKSIDDSDKRPSRQAVFKRLNCLNTQIWPYLSRKYSDLYYSYDKLANKMKGYLVWAADSSSAELPPSEAAKQKYGMHKNNHSKNESSSGKVIVRCGGLYDVVNRFFVDYVITPFKTSEMSIILSQIHMFVHLLVKHKIIILGDRGYGSLQFLAIMQKLGYKFCIRMTTSFYKSYVHQMASNDEYIEIKLTKAVLSRIDDPEALEYLSGMVSFRVRVVKKYYTNPKTGAEEWMILFTNLSEDEFSTNNIFDLYHLRWNIEVAYYSLKVVLELERHISEVPDIAIHNLYGKICFYNLSALFREQLDLIITEEELQERLTGDTEKKKKQKKYAYQTNVKQLINRLYAENLVKCLIVGNDIGGLILTLTNLLYKKIDQMKTQIRPDRHYGRWGKPVTCSYKYKFKIDGRNHQRVAMVGGTMRTVKP